MPDSRVTVPIEDFAQTMRSLFPRYASATDQGLIDIFASENPQCRLQQEGANVTLENLSSILTTEAERQSERLTRPVEPAPRETSNPVVADAPSESAHSQQGDSDSGETVSPTSAISEDDEQNDANHGEPRMLDLERQEKNKRPVALWIACILGLLALGGAGIYYAQHARIENQANIPLRQAAPVPDANAPVPESATTVKEHPLETATATPNAVVRTEADNPVPAIGIGQLFQRFNARNGERNLIDKRIRITGKIEKLGENDVSFMGHEGSLTYWFDVHGFGDTELKSFKEGDSVDVVCEFTGNRANTGDTVMRWSFHGLKIRKASPLPH